MKTYTFWKLISEFDIEVPIIQRDYAQGRINEKVDEIRQNFVRDLVMALARGRFCHLDFVYGKTISRSDFGEYERQKDNVNHLLNTVREFALKVNFDFKYQIEDLPKKSSRSKVLIPLDGQQRLSTLWLIHFYLGSSLGIDIARLNGFSYKTRKSSSEFCASLIAHATEFREINGPISECIEDKEWFFTSWKNDPSVSGMLVMLDEIQRSVKTLIPDLILAWRNLTESEYLSFDFFDLDRFNFEDELYVKMNARGKPLTDYENFKAWLQDEVFSGKTNVTRQDWHAKLDKEWLDVFWKLPGDTDELMLGFFKHMALYKAMEQMHNIKLSTADRQIIERLEQPSYLPTTFYKARNVFNADTLDFIFSTFDLLENGGCKILDNFVAEQWTTTFGGRNFSQALTYDFTTLNRFDRTYVYAVLRFIYLRKKPLTAYDAEDVQKFSTYLRIIRNLIYNTRIDDITVYIDAIQAVRGFGDKVLDFAGFIRSVDSLSTQRWATFFTRIQQQEEWEKNQAIRRDQSWAPILAEAENHHYFYGQIGFILGLSKVVFIPDKTLFCTYFDRLGLIFTNENLDRKDFPIQRALLCCGDYTLDATSNRWHFCSSNRSNSRDREENWRGVFNNDASRAVLKCLLDRMAMMTVQEIIDSYLPEPGNWRNFFIADARILGVCGKKMIKYENDGNLIRLLGQHKLSHYHAELRTYAFYLHFKPILGEVLHYKQSKFSDVLPMLKMELGQTISLIRFNGNRRKFEYYNEKADGNEDFIDIDEHCLIKDELLSFETNCITVL